MIKPNETRVFTFTFFSSLPGQFHSQYYLETDPKLPEALPLIELSGYAVVEDENLEKYNSRSPRRYQFDEEIKNLHVHRFCEEVVDDIFDRVKTPTPPLPDYSVQANRQKE